MGTTAIEERPYTDIESFDTLATATSILEENLTKDSIFQIDDNSFQDLELVLNEINMEQFDIYVSSYIKNYVKGCGFNKLNLKEKSDCDEICVTYLTENKSNAIYYLPCNYDAGIIGASFSPNCNSLIVCSSYDGSDFDDYYENRAEFYLFNIEGTDGLNSINPLYMYETKEWSISDYVWINNNKIGLKMYSENRWGDGSQVDYKYFEALIPDETK